VYVDVLRFLLSWEVLLTGANAVAQKGTETVEVTLFGTKWRITQFLNPKFVLLFLHVKSF
jgi:hypothetical protein